MKFKGYVRKDGTVGSRNYVAVMPSVVCANEVVEAITAQTVNTRGFFHHKGCCQLPPDLEMTTDALIGLGCNPNCAAVLVVSLGCEGVDCERLVKEIAATGKRVEIINIQKLGGTSNSIAKGVDLAQEMSIEISGWQREEADFSNFIMGIKCGASDTTSGIASNAVIGYVSDRIVDMGGTVIIQDCRRNGNQSQVLGCGYEKGAAHPGKHHGGIKLHRGKVFGCHSKKRYKAYRGRIEIYRKTSQKRTLDQRYAGQRNRSTYSYGNRRFPGNAVFYRKRSAAGIPYSTGH